MIAAGDLRERINLQSKVTTRDSVGGESITWKDEGEVWAAVDAITGREVSAASQLEAVITLRIVIRPRDDVSPTWRALWRCRVLSIEAVLPSPTRDRITLLCSDGLYQADRVN